MVTFTDIIKGKFIEEFAAIALQDMLIAIALSFVLSLFILFVYRVTYGGVCFSRSFAGCMIMLTMVTTIVILVISSNLVLSLGMVGALSIVRFRTAVKDAKDTAFLFWGIATGIICGAGYITVSVLATLLLGMLFVGVYAFAGKAMRTGSYMVVVRFEIGCDAERAMAELPGYKLKNKTMSPKFTELVAEVRLNDSNMGLLDEIRQIPGVREISVMSSVGGSVL